MGSISKVARVVRSNRDWRRMLEKHRLRQLPRQSKTTTTLLGATLEVPDAASFLAQFASIYEQEVLRFRTTSERPQIIDCGANIGTSALWFSQQYPQAEIIAFEADPALSAVLARNCRSFQADNIDVRQQAVWIEEGFLDFAGDGKDGGRVVGTGAAHDIGNVKVPSIRLRDLLLAGPVDMLKVDIEGAEEQVMADCADALGHVQNLCVEYHSYKDRPQRLHELLDILRTAGFRYHVMHEGVAGRPLYEPMSHFGMDNQLNIFAARV